MDKFAAFWGLVAQTFADRDVVIGYELMNEPWCGDIYKGRPSNLNIFKANHLNFYQLSLFHQTNDGFPQIQHYCFLGLQTDDICSQCMMFSVMR